MTPMVDCGCCGRIHEDIAVNSMGYPVDCRAFFTCPKCGDGYHVRNLAKHKETCTGEPSGNITEDKEP